jgi:translation initiation factor 3 subunit C
MHLNLEVLECVHLISALLLEVPANAGSIVDPRRSRVSRGLRWLMQRSEFRMRNINTPPETAKDSIVHAARALQTGDWRLCLKSVVNLNVWSKMPPKDYETIKSMLEVGVKEAGLRTFLLAFASCYETISLDQLIERFDMKSEKVYQIVSSMIYSASMVTEHNSSQRFDERTLLHPQLRASWDDRCACQCCAFLIIVFVFFLSSFYSFYVP